VQGYDAQAATDSKHIVIAAERNNDSPDFGHVAPMVDGPTPSSPAIGIRDTSTVLLADAGWHQDQMENIIHPGIQVLSPPDAGNRKGKRPGWDGGLYSFMRRVLDTDHDGGLYAERQGIVAPVFGHTKFNRRCDRFQRRGRAACRSEWRLITATHDLVKLWRHRAAPALA
jgi:hypothetical protein